MCSNGDSFPCRNDYSVGSMESYVIYFYIMAVLVVVDFWCLNYSSLAPLSMLWCSMGEISRNPYWVESKCRQKTKPMAPFRRMNMAVLCLTGGHYGLYGWTLFIILSMSHEHEAGCLCDPITSSLLSASLMIKWIVFKLWCHKKSVQMWHACYTFTQHYSSEAPHFGYH